MLDQKGIELRMGVSVNGLPLEVAVIGALVGIEEPRSPGMSAMTHASGLCLFIRATHRNPWALYRESASPIQ